jgi:hypothetical protein
VISLADYSPTTLKFIKVNDLACVYVFAVEAGRPCKIGHALGLKYRFDQVQSQHPKALTIEHVAWTPSAATAALIAEDISHRLAARAMRMPAGITSTPPTRSPPCAKRAGCFHRPALSSTKPSCCSSALWALRASGA